MWNLTKVLRAGATAGGVLASLAAAPAQSADLVEPLLFSSANGVLDLLMIAKAAPVRTLSPFHPTGWVYEICQRPPGDVMKCPPTNQNFYGGARLQLQQGDHLKIRLVNKLPPAYFAKHALDKGFKYLTLNPTNLHTHGMLVSAHYPTLNNPTYGDNVFVLTLNPDNGQPGANSHIHGDVRNRFTDYDIKVPAHHPSGLFWFHPHAHGVALNQVSSGMAGIITVGDPRDYICGRTSCGPAADDIPPVRHMILKDIQVLPGDGVVDQQNPTFCPFEPFPGDPQRRGACLNAIGSDPKSRGHWFFTINGQRFPTVPVAAPAGEIWRITNTSASVSYNLELWNSAQQRNMMVQVVAIDGVSISPEPVTSTSQLAQVGGTKFDPVPCPVATGASLRATGTAAERLCVRRLVMFPSSRVELWVTYRDSNDAVADPPAGAFAVFRTVGMETGPGGDAWPSVDLARVEFSTAPAAGKVPSLLTVKGEGRALLNPVQLASELAEPKKAFPTEADCTPLAAGHMRRIFFNSLPPPLGGKPGSPYDAETGEAPFGLGYEELDENGQPVPGTFLDVSVFDAGRRTVCLTLGPGNTPVTEQWQLINLASEDHNFHMHQTKFRLLTRDEIDGTTTPRHGLAKGVLHDNVPARHATGTCNSVDDWRQGKCVAHPVVVEIPFTVPGDYVYHCHILEHEDGGMMARIRVRQNRS